MSKIFVNQSKLKIVARLQADITGYSAVKLLYRKPDNSEGELAATVENVSKGIISHDIVPAANTLDTAGNWRFKGEASFSDGGKIEGDWFQVKVHERWE